MTKHIGSFIGMAILLAAVSASAQSSNEVRVKVPFSFVTAGKTWPAADYIVQIHTENGTVTLTSPGIATATLLTNSDERPVDGRTYLEFQRSSDRWFLREVTVDGLAHIFPSRELEKALVEERMSVEAQ